MKGAIVQMPQSEPSKATRRRRKGQVIEMPRSDAQKRSLVQLAAHMWTLAERIQADAEEILAREGVLPRGAA